MSVSPDTLALVGTTTTIPPELEEIPVPELVELLNDAFDVELRRRLDSHRAEEVVADPDAGLRAAKGIMIAGLVGLAMWAGILAVIVAFAG